MPRPPHRPPSINPLPHRTPNPPQEARFDRHFVRDLTWSRHQLEELAERRFLAAQLEAQRRAAAASGPGIPARGGVVGPDQGLANADVTTAAGGKTYSFADLFKAVKVEDFSSYLSKLHTPRELMIMMVRGGHSGGDLLGGIGGGDASFLAIAGLCAASLVTTWPWLRGRRRYACPITKPCGRGSSSNAPSPTHAHAKWKQTEMMSRMEAHPEGGLTAQDMEISVTKALEQAV